MSRPGRLRGPAGGAHEIPGQDAGPTGTRGRLHVLFVLDTWGLIGGTERYAAAVIPALLERGHRVTVLCREDRREGIAPVEAIEVPALAGAGMGRADRRELAGLVERRAPDVAYVSSLRNNAAAEELVEAVPVVRYVHDHTLFCPGLNKMREDGEVCREPMGLVCLERYFLSEGCVCFKRGGHRNRLVDPLRELAGRLREVALVQRSTLVLTNSDYMRSELVQVGFDPQRTATLYLFTRSGSADLPPGELDAETERFLAAGSGEPLLFTPARLTLPDKGVDYLLTALAAVVSPFRAVIAGSGPAEPWLRAKAREEGLADRVRFTGWIEPGAIERLYERAHAVVCPSVWNEPFGLVGLEAMAHGKPVVAFRVGGIPEWLEDGRTGFLVERKDTAGMARAVDELCADPGLAARLGSQGRSELGRRFSRDLHLDGLERALHRAAGR